MKTLTVFYDARCGLCARFRAWLEAEPRWVAVEFLAYDSPEATRRFPGLLAMGAAEDVVVLADDGRWWQGAGAWITCLWTTRDYRAWSFRLAAPVFHPLVRKAVHLVSQNRLALSGLLAVREDWRLAESLEAQPAPRCAEGSCALPS